MIRILVTFILALGLFACSTISVYTDYNPAAQFSTYRTYSWDEKPEGISPLMTQRIVDAVDAQLRAKGWTQVAAVGDVAVAAHVDSHREYEMDAFYGGPYWGGWGWSGWGGWGGYGSTRVHSYTVGTLAVDMFDTRTRQAIWRGIAEGTVKRDPAAATADIQSAVTRMFAAFPPGSAPAP